MAVKPKKDGSNKSPEHKRKLLRNIYRRRIYNQTYRWEFPDPGKINMTTHFFFPKMLGDVEISTAAMAVYPALCLAANFEREEPVQISRENIAKMVGITAPSVDKGVRDLCRLKYKGKPLLTREMTQRERRRFYLYWPFFIRKYQMEDSEVKFFPFYKCLIDGGVWADLKPRAKSLYVALRQTAFFDIAAYAELEPDDCPDGAEDFDWNGEGYRNRKWEINLEQVAELCRLANVDRSDIDSAFDQLVRHGLIERVDRWFMVYLKPNKSEKK